LEIGAPLSFFIIPTKAGIQIFEMAITSGFPLTWELGDLRILKGRAIEEGVLKEGIREAIRKVLGGCRATGRL